MSSSLPIRVDTLILGAGLAGLGSALGTRREGHAVVILEVTPKPDFSKPLRYDTSMPASYKSAGMFMTLHPHANMLNFFMRETAKEYEKLAIPIRRGGLSVLMDTSLATVVEELTDRRETLHGYELKKFEPKEPHLHLDHVKGVVRQEEAMNANPEETMQALIASVEAAGVTIKWNTTAKSCTRRETDTTRHQFWAVATSEGQVYEAENIIVACGPWSVAVCQKLFGVYVPMSTVLGVITEFEGPKTDPHWFNGLVMSARSIQAWTTGDFIAFLKGKDRLEITRKDGSRRHVTTHLYVACQETSGSVYVGGPRVLVGDATSLPVSKLNPKLYAKDMAETIRYANTLMKLPEKVIGEWSGLMAFTNDEMPVVGRASHVKGVYICTGFASGGYREAVGAGVWLGKCVARNGGDPIIDADDKDQAMYREVLPEGRIGPKGSLATEPRKTMWAKIMALFV